MFVAIVRFGRLRTGQRKAFAALAHAVLDRRRRVADLLLVLGVEVVDEVPPGLVSGRQEELHGLVVDLLRDADADGTAGAAHRGAAKRVVLHGQERREHLVP